MKYFVILLIFIGFSVPVFGDESSYSPTSEPEQDISVSTNCGEGTTYQDGVCVVDKSQNISSNSSVKWGTGVNFPHALQLDNSKLSLFDNIFSVTEKQVRYDVFYNVTNASINNVKLNCDSSSLMVSILSDYDGTLQLDIPKGMLGGIFMVLVDDKEWDDVSIDGNTLTVNFTEDASTIKILGSYELSTSKNDGVCDVIHDPPHSYIVSPLKQFDSGVSFDKIECKDNLVLIQKYDGSPACVTEQTKTKLIERGWTEQITDVPSKHEEMHDLKKILTENNINYLPDKLVVTPQSTLFAGDPACGAVVDTTSNIHWFGIDSISEPKKITLYPENPNQCEVNTTSCFCNVQIELASLTLDELEYFSLQEQEEYADILIDYLYDENINRTPKFMIGKHNVNYTDPYAIGYCGKIWGANTYGYFDGAIVNGKVRDYGISKELPLLCALGDDSQYFGNMFGEK